MFLKVTRGPSGWSERGSVREQHNGLERGHFWVSLRPGQCRGLRDRRRPPRRAAEGDGGGTGEGSRGCWGLGASPEPLPRLAPFPAARGGWGEAFGVLGGRGGEWWRPRRRRPALPPEPRAERGVAFRGAAGEAGTRALDRAAASAAPGGRGASRRPLTGACLFFFLCVAGPKGPHLRMVRVSGSTF